MLPELIIHEIAEGNENSNSESELNYLGEQLWYGNAGEADFQDIPEVQESKKTITVGDTLPYGIRMFQGCNNVFRLKDIGVKTRILVVGVIGSFTPLCWNHHFLEILTNVRYYEERGISYICCISTNDAYTQGAWGTFLGCYDSVLMIGDPLKIFTKAIGMDIVVPWIDNLTRSRRYVIYAEDMVVTKLLVASKDHLPMKFSCDHVNINTDSSETTSSDTGSTLNSW